MVSSRVIIDNWTETVKTVKFKDISGDTKTISLAPKSSRNIEVPLGSFSPIVDGIVKDFSCRPYVDHIFNIDTAQAYILTEVKYGNSQNDDLKFEIIRDEFFENPAEFLFEAPEALIIKDGDQTKSVLYRSDDIK